MSDRAAFVAAIEADPDSDLPRLAWADWLEEYGDARDRKRAELIRVQCARIHAPTDTLLSRERQLLALLRRVWPTELAMRWLDFSVENSDELARPPREIRFRRGCLAGVVLPANDLVTATAAFAGREPLPDVEVQGWKFGGPAPPERLLGLRSVTYCPPGLVPRLATSPAAGRLRSLTIEDGTGRYSWASAELVTALAGTPEFAGLVRLSVSGVRFTPDDLRVLIASPHLSPALSFRIHPPAGGSAERRLRDRFTGPDTSG